MVVDPKASDVSTYRGCTAITPNEHEAEIASGISVASDAGLEEAARRIGAAAGCGWVLVTRGERGMALSGPHGPLAHIPAEAREVYDVTGAGDTVLAYFGLGLAARLEPLQAATLANRAAGVAVGKVGTSPVDRAELLASFLGSGASASKFVDLRQAVARVEQQRSQGRRIVLTNGCFDLLHAGHVHLLERARALGDVLVVALNTDASVRRLKGEGRPVVGEWDRVRVLSALDAVSLVLLFDEDTPLEVIRRLRPDVLVKGGDYSVDTIVGADVVLAHGGRVETISLAPGRSTSALLSAIRQADEA